MSASANPDINAPYNYDGIDDKLKKKAQKELGENPEQVRAHIASLRRWLQSMPHIKNCRTDDKFLLRFLRIAKFDHNRAQALVDNYCTVRKSERGCPDWFQNPEPEDLEFYLNEGCMTYCGTNDNGECVLIHNIGKWNPDVLPFDRFIRCAYANIDSLVRYESIQICGVIIIMEMSQLGKKQISHIENPRVMFKIIRNMQDALPLRIKAMLYWKEPLIFDVVYNLIKAAPFVKKKLKDRLHKCGPDAKKLARHVGPGAEKILPVELGGKNGTVAEMAARSMSERREGIARERQLLADLQVDESLRQPMTMDYLMSYDQKAVDSTMGVSGTYTKFDV